MIRQYECKSVKQREDMLGHEEAHLVASDRTGSSKVTFENTAEGRVGFVEGQFYRLPVEPLIPTKASERSMTAENAVAVAHRLWGRQAFAEEYEPSTGNRFTVGWRSLKEISQEYSTSETTTHVYGRSMTSWEEAFADAMTNFAQWANEP